ncbi:inositol monophosphatase family protein [Streptomyces sp. NPDC060022]|uniref:inositol monophosphatase family protein n=1 Tax=Streptomyces sp. NPDC060022 TaxID=3347039 RepID=UPI0036C3CE08
MPDEDSTERDAILLTAVAACRAAGRLVTGRGRVDSESKANAHDLVTSFDAEAERLVTEMILGAHPGSSVVGEESGVSGNTDGEADLRWFVDPIDGTGNFARGLPLFCVSIGVEKADSLEIGCIYDPVRGEMFTTTGPADGVRVDARHVEDPPPGPGAARPLMLLTDFPLAGMPASGAELALFAELNQTFDLRRVGSSALALAWVAAGRADLACNIAIHPWDVAAGFALVNAASGGYLPLRPPRTAAGERRPYEEGGFVAHGPHVSPDAAAFLAKRILDLPGAATPPRGGTERTGGHG